MIVRGLIKVGVVVELINCEVVIFNEIREVVEKCDGFIIGFFIFGGYVLI